MRAGRVDLTEFWRRRARRLLPALLLVLAVSLLAARIVEPDLLVDSPRQVVGAVTFSTNWVEIAAGSDYFDDTSPKLFVTLWSLAVEEQFYVLFPLALLGLLALTRRHVVGARVAVGMALASALLMARAVRAGHQPHEGLLRHRHPPVRGDAGCRAGVRASPATWGCCRGGAGCGSGGGSASSRWPSSCVLMLVVDAGSDLAYRGGILLASLLTVVVLASLPGPRERVHRHCTSGGRWRGSASGPTASTSGTGPSSSSPSSCSPPPRRVPPSP